MIRKSILGFIISFFIVFSAYTHQAIVIAANDFTEQFILGYILQILIEENTDLNTRLVSNLSITSSFQGITRGEIDLSIAYTGTIVENIFYDTIPRTPDETFRIARDGLRDRYSVRMLDKIGFNNTFTLAVRPDTAQQFNLRTISDLARVSSQLIFGGTLEFANRLDGLLGLRRAYEGLNFRREVIIIHDILRYNAVINDEIQVTNAFSTEGVLEYFNLVALEDDLEFFPAFHAAVIIREETAQKFPQLVEVSNMLAGVIDNDSMRYLNFRVDVLHESPQHTARTFLRETGLIR